MAQGGKGELKYALVIRREVVEIKMRLDEGLQMQKR